MTSGAGSHQSASALKEEWLTPPSILQALGPFDLDPCAPADRPWATAALHYTIFDDGLSKDWHGRVWCNPPYGNKAERWLKRCADHGDAIALIFARTETRMFFDQVWSRARAVFFLRGRIHFYHANGSMAASNAGAPSVLVAYGGHNAEALRGANLEGQFLALDREPMQRERCSQQGLAL